MLNKNITFVSKIGSMESDGDNPGFHGWPGVFTTHNCRMNWSRFNSLLVRMEKEQTRLFRSVILKYKIGIDDNQLIEKP